MRVSNTEMLCFEGNIGIRSHHEGEVEFDERLLLPRTRVESTSSSTWMGRLAVVSLEVVTKPFAK